MAKQQVIGVDIGNTSIKTAEFFTDDIGEIRRWESESEILEEFDDAFFVVVSVRKNKPDFPNYWQLTHESKLPIRLNYDTPETLGLDRIASAVGAHSHFPKTNLLIIDGGSCVTYDLVSEDGAFEGGVISPGLEMRYRAMHEFTGKLPKLSHSISEINLPGKSTEECIRAGAELGLKNEIEGFLQTFNKKLPDLQVVTTGGLLPCFDSSIKKPIFASSKIVLSGLYAIWKFNEET